jgi:UDP-GlcNAc3NAcA epimerase
MINRFGLNSAIPQNVRIIDPVAYADLLSLLRLSESVVTDSGGVQREAVFLKKPVSIARPETEWTDFEKLKKVRVVGYDFELSNMDFDNGDPDDTLSYLLRLRPASDNMMEILTSVFK